MTNGRAVTETVAAKSSRSSLRYALLGVVVLGFSLVGYVGFVIYPGLDLSAGVHVEPHFGIGQWSLRERYDRQPRTIRAQPRHDHEVRDCRVSRFEL